MFGVKLAVDDGTDFFMVDTAKSLFTFGNAVNPMLDGVEKRLVEGEVADAADTVEIDVARVVVMVDVSFASPGFICNDGAETNTVFRIFLGEKDDLISLFISYGLQKLLFKI